MRGKRAFSFFGKAAQGITGTGTSFASKSNVILMAIDAGVALVEAGCSYLRYWSEKANTAELRRQIEHLQRDLDKQVEEAHKRADIEVEEVRKRLLATLEREEAELRANFEWMQGQVEAQLTQRALDHAQWMKVMEIEERARRPLRRAMETVAELIEQGRAEGTQHTLLAQLEEEYRICATQYDQMIQNAIRGNQA